MTERVLVAMSGGVDSSVAAALLKERGFDLVGVTLHLWDAHGDQQVGRCCAPEDREDARRVCDQLAIPHYVIDERAAFTREVVHPFVRSNAAGLTPSPCSGCNRQVKLARLVELADRWAAAGLATGHYARVELDSTGMARLLRGRDSTKDQSYFLYGVQQDVLRRMRFVLGDMTKHEARQHALRLGLNNWNKPDSQQLCFVPDGKVSSFVRGRLEGPEADGDIVDTEGRRLGRHDGLSRFTVGQRRGLCISGGKPRYVLRILPATRTVVVGDEAGLYTKSLQATAATWLSPPPAEPFTAHVRVRHRHEPAGAVVTASARGFSVRFGVAQRAIAPGQAAVVYRGDEVLGGGTIVADTQPLPGPVRKASVACQ